jgi:DNA polymerase-2
MSARARAEETHTGRLLHPTYRVRSGQPVVQLYGRLDDGRPFLVEDDRFRPYFYVRSEHEGRLHGIDGVTLRATELHDLAGKPLTRVTLPLPSAVRSVRDRLQGMGIACFEADIRFPYRYLMDKALRTELVVHGRPSPRPGGLQYFHDPELGSGRSRARFTVLSLDLETTPDASAIYSAALVGCGVEEAHLVATAPVHGATGHSDERALLLALAARIRALDPDVLIGWNVVDFDLQVLARRFDALGLTLQEASLGRTPGRIEFQSDRGFARQGRASIPGRMVVDGLPLAREALRLDDYRLGTVARAVLGRGKLIDEEAPDAAAEITRMYREEPEALVAYNLEDARLVPDVLEREGLIDLTFERSRLTGMQLDRVAASIASFDLLYLPELRRHGFVAPSVDADRSAQPVTGGAVLDSTPGLARNVAVFDFRSLYPSLMRTFNLDPLALARGRSAPEGATVLAPNGARFARDEAILPRIIERFMESREAARKRGDRHATQAIKIMMNSMFGVFAAPSCRFFSPELANAITTFGQQTLAWTAEAFEEAGLEVIYGDTDSVFVRLDPDETLDAARAQAEAARTRVARRVVERIAERYDVESKLDLELEKIFSRFFLPRVRGGGGGSKKRYAGWVGAPEDGRLETVGLESVRRDWPAVARRLQEGMLTRLFHDAPVATFVAEIVDRVRAGELDDELVYRKGIRKGSLDSYAGASPPHVQAARKLLERTGRPPRGVVRYVITHAGPEPVLPGAPPRTDIDRAHYVERVLRPIADAILIEIGETTDGALGEPEQLDLL